MEVLFSFINKACATKWKNVLLLFRLPLYCCRARMLIVNNSKQLKCLTKRPSEITFVPCKYSVSRSFKWHPCQPNFSIKSQWAWMTKRYLKVLGRYSLTIRLLIKYFALTCLSNSNQKRINNYFLFPCVILVTVLEASNW